VRLDEAREVGCSRGGARKASPNRPLPREIRFVTAQQVSRTRAIPYQPLRKGASRRRAPPNPLHRHEQADAPCAYGSDCDARRQPLLAAGSDFLDGRPVERGTAPRRGRSGGGASSSSSSAAARLAALDSDDGAHRRLLALHGAAARAEPTAQRRRRTRARNRGHAGPPRERRKFRELSFECAGVNVYVAKIDGRKTPRCSVWVGEIAAGFAS
jgi:hypothetical protein